MKTFKKACTISFALALSSTLMPIFAQSEEITLRGPISFSTYDKDNNGLISEAEFNDIRTQRISAKGSQGKLMRGAANPPSFSTFDSNGDGQLTQDELTAGQQAQMANRQNKKQAMRRGLGKGKNKGKHMPTFEDFDLNSDGKLLEEEFYEARAKRISERAKQGFKMKNIGSAPSFADIDTNNNGEISDDEFSVHQQKHMMNRKR